MPYGLDNDRLYVLGHQKTAGGEWVQITQRVRPALAAISTEPSTNGGSMRLTAKDGSSIDIRLIAPDEMSDMIKLKLFTAAVDAVVATSDAAEEEKLNNWLNRHAPSLGSSAPLPIRLFRVPEVSSGQVSEMASLPLIGRVFDARDRCGFPDFAPLLATSPSSLASLVAHQPHGTAPTPMDRFRPNLVVDGLPAWAEDRIDEIEIVAAGSGQTVTRLRKFQDCTRCVMPSIDQRTGHAGFREDVKNCQPLETLRRVRPGRELAALVGALAPDEGGGGGVGGRSPVFGAYFGYSVGYHPQPGAELSRVCVGDKVRITKWLDHSGRPQDVVDLLNGV